MPRFPIAALAAGILLTMGSLRVADLRWSRAETLRSAEARAANLALIVSAYLGEAFAAGDASLRQLALHSRRVGGPAATARDWLPSLASARAGLTSFGAIVVIDRDGIIRQSTRPEIVGQSRRDQYLFRATIEAPGDDLVVGTPFPTIETPPQLIIPIGRRLTNEDGSVAGAVIASFLPAAPRAFFQTVDVGERGTIWVFHPSGVVLFREPSAANPIGQPASNNPIFEAATRRGGTGALEAPLEPGGPVFMSAYHAASAPPMIVAVSLDRDEVLAAWRREATSSAAVFAVVALTLGVVLIGLHRVVAANARTELELVRAREVEAARLQEANERLASSLEREQSARREAEAASALKDQFLMTVSHELRTPLTAIYGWARMLNRGALSERRKEEALRTIERNAHAQTRLIDDLLELSRAMGGNLRLDIRAVHIADVLQNAVETIRPAADAKSIRLETAIDGSAGRISGDPERLQQVVWNLLSNAVKFTPNGGRVNVSMTRAGTDIEIAVFDTGVGISPEFLPHVFERFRQEDGGTTRRYGGLGLGLAIVRNLVELHGGSVAAESDGEGRGATFTVRLPAREIPAPVVTESITTTRGTADVSSAAARLDGIRLLVVDDDPEARELFAAILQAAGATVESAASVREALAMLRGTSYDALLSDIEMPEADGYTLVQQALAISSNRGERLMAVAITAYSRPEDEARSVAAGFHRHVKKPVDPGKLTTTIADCVMRGAF